MLCWKPSSVTLAEPECNNLLTAPSMNIVLAEALSMRRREAAHTLEDETGQTQQATFSLERT
jgi:hypothetical protein